MSDTFRSSASSASTSPASRSPTATSSVIHVEDVHKYYDLGETKVHALRGVNVRIERGEFVAWEDAMTAIERMDRLFIAGINGHCLGGGLQLTLVCDYRLAVDPARLGLPAVKDLEAFGERLKSGVRGQELGRVGAVEDAVVAGERDRHLPAHSDLAVADDDARLDRAH